MSWNCFFSYIQHLEQSLQMTGKFVCERKVEKLERKNEWLQGKKEKLIVVRLPLHKPELFSFHNVCFTQPMSRYPPGCPIDLSVQHVQHWTHHIYWYNLSSRPSPLTCPLS